MALSDVKDSVRLSASSLMRPMPPRTIKLDMFFFLLFLSHLFLSFDPHHECHAYRHLPQVMTAVSPSPTIIVSVIVPLFNAAPFLHDALDSVLRQCDIPLNCVEVIIYDDNSTDDSLQVATTIVPLLQATLGKVVLLPGRHGPLGCGSARNRACAAATSEVLVFLDADDLMHPTRLSRTLSALGQPEADVVGGAFDRLPQGSTPRYELYHRQLTTADIPKLMFRDAPLPMPTVACRTAVWRAVPFVEGRSIPEDLHFQYGAMAAGFTLCKLGGDSLVVYRFHPRMTSLSLDRRALLAVRVRAFEQLVLQGTGPPFWCAGGWEKGFAIWGSGRDGKEVYKLLSDSGRRKLTMWGDIDPRKIGTSLKERPVVHFTKLHPPIACCVALDREGREFEANLASLHLRPGIDYVHLT